MILAVSFTVLGGVCQLINHVFFPQAVLLSYTQIRRATELYKVVEQEDKGIPFEEVGKETILNYIQNAKIALTST